MENKCESLPTACNGKRQRNPLHLVTGIPLLDHQIRKNKTEASWRNLTTIRRLQWIYHSWKKQLFIIVDLNHYANPDPDHFMVEMKGIWHCRMIATRHFYIDTYVSCHPGKKRTETEWRSSNLISTGPLKTHLEVSIFFFRILDAKKKQSS